MLVRPPKISISDTSPFGADKLGRSESGDRLTHLLERVKPPFVLAIDAKYGNGKTTFIQMWMAHLKTKGFRSLYFNAWESDFAADPLIAFIGEMDAQINCLLIGSESVSKLRASWDKVKKVGSYLAKRAVPVGLKIATADLLDLDKFTEQSIANLAADIAREQIEKYEGTKNRIKEFRTLLGEFIRSLATHEQRATLPLVFFVDELDRCRPPYAVELLERIKHFFGIEEIVFVLAIDKTQLFSSIRSVYGGDIDVDGYLRRFIDLEYRFPPPKADGYHKYLAVQFGLTDLLARMGDRNPSPTIDISVRTFTGLADSFGLTLRIQEQCFATLSVILLTGNLRSTQLPLLIALLALQSAAPDLYTAFLSGAKGVKDVVSFILDTQKGQAFMEDFEGILLETYLLKSLRGKDPSAKTLIDSYKATKNAYRVESGPPNQAVRRAEAILTRVLSEDLNYDMVEEAARSIAFAGHFNPRPSAGPNGSVN